MPRIIESQRRKQAKIDRADKRAVLKIGQRVLVMAPFSKFGHVKWYTEEVFRIAKIYDAKLPVVYGVTDEDGNVIGGRLIDSPIFRKLKIKKLFFRR